MAKSKKPEDYGKFVDRMTGEAIVALGAGNSLRSIISGIVASTSKWRQDWDDAEER